MIHPPLGIPNTLLLSLVLLLCGALTGCSPAVTTSAGRTSYPDTTGSPSASKNRPFAKQSSPGIKNARRPAPSRVVPSRSKSPATPAASGAKKDIIEVVLTFDDGPHAAPPVHGRNHTLKVFHNLKNNVVQANIKAVFFIQTHAPGRGATPIGQSIIAMLAQAGHIIGIHTGSTADHASHRTRAIVAPYDVNRNGVLDTADGTNGLESDMIRAKARIRKLTGSESLYVRPTYGERNRTVRAVYRRQHLKMILWDIDSADNIGSPSVDVVNFNIDKGMRRCVAAGKKQIVILFHDINSRTALNLEEYLGNICISARKLGKTVVFPTTAERVMQILNAKTYL